MSDQGSGNKIVCQPLPASDRNTDLKAAFSAHHQCGPDFYVRVPGRVNLIGEHIDYCGYGVCPMALEQDIMLAIATDTTGLLRLNNVDSIHKAFECPMKNLAINLDGGAPKWHQYFLCGVKGILDILPKDVALKGLKVTVNGTIPPSAGLSSSSALVSAAALATSYAHDFPLSKERIAGVCAECERYIGTQGGGMDQAIAFLATEGCAKLINFSPLRSEDVTLPRGAVFVIAHSLTRLNKAATADFNCRVVECRLAAQLLAKKSGLEWKGIKKLGELQMALKVNLESMISIVIKNLHEEPYSKEEILGELDATDQEVEKYSLTDNTRDIQSFKLFQRALHVFQEALRVQNFHEVCVGSSGDGTLEILGKLMSESHASLRDLYECSHPQLDRLIELSRGLTLGCRLTGAGWGGCAVALLKPENVDEYIAFLKDKFYGELGVSDKFESLIFATAPNAGACVYM